MTSENTSETVETIDPSKARERRLFLKFQKTVRNTKWYLYKVSGYNIK